MADPTFVATPVVVMGLRFGCTKNLMPLLHPGLNLKSTSNSKSEYFPRVMISPPTADSPPLLFVTHNSPSLIVQLCVGNSIPLALTQPAVVLPSQSSRQPSFFSRSV